MTTPISQRRTHHLLLINRLLSLKENASPFTLILDSLSQSSKPLIKEYISNASSLKYSTIFISFETLRPPLGITKFINARGIPLQFIQKEIANAVSPGGHRQSHQRTLIIIDSLIPICSQYPAQVSSFLGPLVSPATSLLATYHLDIPLTPSPSISQTYPHTAPHPLTLLKHLCTTLISVHSINHMLLQKRHRDQALLPPRWGLLEESERGEVVEGVVVGLGSNSHSANTSGGEGGIVLEMEHRRKSGRGMSEFFFLRTCESDKVNDVVSKNSNQTLGMGTGRTSHFHERIILLEDHPQWRSSEIVRDSAGEKGLGTTSDLGMMQTTFDLSLTERQRKARDEVILPYFDAQKEDGIGGRAGGGGMILFTPGREEDFDEEEDEL